MKVANFIIAGVNKAGSTSLFHYLTAHPEICGSKDKETCYFLPILYQDNPNPISEYEKQFSGCQEYKIRMESTPAYMFGGERMAKTIKSTLPDVKILIILKDPVERTRSFYTRKKSTLQLPQELSFKDYIDKCLSFNSSELDRIENQLYTGVYLSRYSEFIEPWLDVFGKNIKVVFFDELKSDPGNLLADICKWLGISPEFYTAYEFDVKNRSVSYKNRGMHRIAVWLNLILNKLWRWSPELKSAVLRCYYFINGQSFDKSDIDRATIDNLYSYFRPYNEKLHKILVSAKVANIPTWVSGIAVANHDSTNK